MAMFHFRLKSDKKPNGTKISAVKHVEYINREGAFSDAQHRQSNDNFVSNFITTEKIPNALIGDNVLLYKTNGLGVIRNTAKGIEVSNKEVVVQRCIVHLIRNSLKYVPTRDYKNFTAHLKKIYGAPNLNACRVEFECFCQVWAKYPGAIAVWKRCFAYVEQLFDFPSAVRKIMYTTNAIEAVNSSFRKVTKRGAFQSDNPVFKLLCLHVLELEKKWSDRPIPNWSLVLNQLLLNDRLAVLFDKFDR